MKAYKVEVLIINFDELEENEIKDVLENTYYSNHCISPEVLSIESKDIGEWNDDHPLNKKDTRKNEIQRLFEVTKETTKLRFGFKGKKQLPLFMIWEEDFVNDELVFARVIFNSQYWIGI
jgi:hypothetical protein